MAFVFNPFTGQLDAADQVTFTAPPVDLSPYELKKDSEKRDQDLQDQIDAIGLSANKVWTRTSTDAQYTEADGVLTNDLQYVTDKDELYIYRDIKGDGSTFYWVQALYGGMATT